MKNIIKFIPLLSLLFLLNGCLIPFSSARIVPKGGTEVGTGVAGGREEGECGYDCYALLEQSVFIIRRGIGHNMDCGIEIGLIALSLDIRKQILSESSLHPSIVLSGKAFGYNVLGGEIGDSGYGGGISLQFHYKIFSFFSNYFYANYRWQNFTGVYLSGESRSHIFANTLMAEFPLPKKWDLARSINLLIGKYFESSLEPAANRSVRYWGISFLGRTPKFP